jgi:hypothetical protein
MPYQFRYFINKHLVFQSNLICEQCKALTKSGNRCKRMVCIGLPYCFSHLASIQHLKIKPSTISNAGKGLFAIDTSKRPNAVIFNQNAIICDYNGEIIDRNELIHRYNYHTAPYGIRINKNRFEDGALMRGIAGLANHKSFENCNAVFRPFKANGKFYMRLIAVKPIRNGDEIFADYGDDYIFDDGSSYKTTYVISNK